MTTWQQFVNKLFISDTNKSPATARKLSLLRGIYLGNWALKVQTNRHPFDYLIRQWPARKWLRPDINHPPE